MWIGISILIVLISGLVIWFLSSSGVSEVSGDLVCVRVYSEESFRRDCRYLASVGLLRESDSDNFLSHLGMLEKLHTRYCSGFDPVYHPKPIIEDGFISVNMNQLVARFKFNPDDQTLFEVYDKASRLRRSVRGVEKDLRLAKKYKVPYYVNFEGGVYWVLPN